MVWIFTYWTYEISTSVIFTQLPNAFFPCDFILAIYRFLAVYLAEPHEPCTESVARKQTVHRNKANGAAR